MDADGSRGVAPEDDAWEDQGGEAGARGELGAGGKLDRHAVVAAGKDGAPLSPAIDVLRGACTRGHRGSLLDRALSLETF